MPSNRTELILKILRPIAKAYEHPPLSWMEKAVGWCAATRLRFAVTMTVAAAVFVLAVIVDA